MSALRIRHLTEGSFPTADERALARGYHDAMELWGLSKQALADIHDVPVETIESVLSGRAFIETGPPADPYAGLERADVMRTFVLPTADDEMQATSTVRTERLPIGTEFLVGLPVSMLMWAVILAALGYLPWT
ncbi:MAG: hypothetical protein ACR2RE_27915 [Geminicoccaceae bacterium]